MFRFISVILAAMVCSSVARAQPLAERVPADALLYLGWQGSESLPAGFDQTHLRRVLDAGGLAQVFSDFYPRLIERIAADDRATAAVMARIGALAGPVFRHPTALFAQAVEGTPIPRLVLICQAGAESDALAAQLDQLVAASGLPGRAAKEGDLVFLLVGSDANGPVAAKDAANSLASVDGFKGAMAQVGRSPVLAVYANVAGVVAAAEQANAAKPSRRWAAIRDGLGLRGVQQFAWTGGFEGPDWATRGFAGAPSPRLGPAAALDAPPLSDDLLKAVPRGATWVSASRVELAGLLEQIRAVVMDFDSEAGKTFDQALGAIQMGLGFNLEKDLFASLGPEWAVYSDPAVAGHGPMGFVIVNQLRDPAGAQRSLKKLWLGLDNVVNSQMPTGSKMRVNFEAFKSNGIEVNYVGVPLVSPAWAIAGGKLYVGLYPQMVVGGIEAAGKGESVLDNPEFVKLRKELGGEKAGSLTFVDLPRSAPEGYQTMLVFLQAGMGFAEMFGVKPPPMMLPPFTRFAGELNAAGEFGWSDDLGYHWRGREPFPASTALASQNNIVIGYSAVLTSILLPALNTARERANRVKCAMNLKQIGHQCLIYANDHNDAMPPDLGALIEGSGMHPQNFVCPSGNTDLPAEINGDPKKIAAWVNEHADYVYLGTGKKAAGDADFVVAYEKPDNHDRQGMNMLFLDGHVEWQTMPAALEIIRKQQAADVPRGGKL